MSKNQKMKDTRVTFISTPTLVERVNEHCKESGENLSDFYNRAILNQLETDGDFEIRTILEEEAEREGNDLKWQ